MTAQILVYGDFIMKIAFVSASYYVHIDYKLIPELNSRFEIGWFPYFVHGRSPDELLEKKKSINVSKFDYTELKDGGRRFSRSRTLFDFLKKVKAWNPDVVYLNADEVPFLPVFAQLLFGREKVIAACHDPKPHSGETRLTRIYKNLLPKFYINLNAYSEFSFRQLKEIVGKQKIVTLAHHPLGDYGDVVRKIHERRTVLFFGRLVPYKGLDILIKAGERAYEKDKRLLIKICGGGSYYGELLEEITNHPAFAVTHRFIAESEIPEIVSDVDWWVLPYRDATQSGPLMMALNYRIPVVASNIDAFKEFGDKFECVDLIENNVEAWTQKLLEICNKKVSENRRRVFEQQILEFNDQILNEWVDLFEGRGRQFSKINV